MYQRVNKEGKKEQKIKKEVKEEVITVFEKMDSESEKCLTDTTERSKIKARQAISASSSENGSKLTKIQEESMDDISKLKKGRMRINSADADVISDIQNYEKEQLSEDGRKRSGSSDGINNQNHEKIGDVNLPKFIYNGAFFSKKQEDKNTKDQKDRRFLDLRKIEECDEELEDNENAVAPSPKKKSRRKTRSSRWAKAVKGVAKKSEDNMRTLELLKQFQKNKIHVDNGIILEEEESISSENIEPSNNEKNDSKLAEFLKSENNYKGAGYLNIPVRNKKEEKGDFKNEISPLIEPKTEIKAEKEKKPNYFLNKSFENITSAQRNLSDSKILKISKEENSTVKKSSKGNKDNFNVLNDSCDTKKCIETDRNSTEEKESTKITRTLFKTKSHEIKFEKRLELKNDHILTHFQFNVNSDRNEDPIQPKSSREGTNQLDKPFKKQIEKSKKLTKSSPKIGKLDIDKKKKDKNRRDKVKSGVVNLNVINCREDLIENIKKIKLRLHDLKINPNKIETPKVKR